MTDNRDAMSLRALADRLHESAWQKDVGLVDSDREDAAIALREYADYLSRAAEPVSAVSVFNPEEMTTLPATLTATHPSADALDSGLGLIAAERKRHVTEEGWTPEHDDEHVGGEMADAAACYADAAGAIIRGADPLDLHNPAEDYSHYDGPECGPVWPWDSAWLKLSPDPIRNLVKAGALIAAEIDRLQRTAAPKPPAQK